ncbi:MAG: dihydrodipicolinate synthase family protein [Pseudomonadota bacterium]
MAATGQLEGVIAPVVTPFGEDGTADAKRFVEQAQWLLEDGCTGLAPFGTTSEGNSLGLDERMELLEELVDAGVDPAVLMPGTGTCSLSDTITLTQHAVDIGCAGALVLPPFYYPNPTDDGLFRYFAELIEEVGDDGLALYLYHIPQMSGVGYSIDLIQRLRGEFPEVVAGLKDSSGDWSNMERILTEVPDFDLFPGSESYLLAGLKLGGAGVISAVANVNARAMRRVFDNFESEDAEAFQASVTAFRKTAQSYPLVQGMKALIAHYRNDPVWADVRAPLLPMPENEIREMAARLARDHDFVLRFTATT